MRNPIAPMAAAFCATLVGVGLQRFAYAPLLPAMVQTGLLSAPAAGVLAAANLAGYLAGALLAAAVGRRFGLVAALRGAMVLTALTFAACALPGGLAWLLPWRMLSGAGGAVLMVLTGPAVQLAVPPSRRGLAAGVMLAGVGSGIVIGAALVPAILRVGIAATWLALAASAALLGLLSWRLWPRTPPPPARRPGAPTLSAASRRLIAAYALAAMAATPHMIWWPDFIARGLARGTTTAAGYWVAFGVAAMLGPALFGRLGDRVGAGAALSVTLLLQTVAIGLPILSTDAPALWASSVLTGGCALAISALTLTRAREVAGDAAPGVWRLGTAAYGAAQSATGFALSGVYALGGGHLPLFWVGMLASLGALLVARR